MNQGFFGFPLSTNVRFLEKATFDQSGIYEIPRHTSTLLIYAIGAGGGGGAGSSRGTAYQGGNGGSGGAHGFITLFTDEFKYFFDVESNINATQNYLPYKLVITIGAGGTGGVAGSVGSGQVNGIAGGDTVISLYSTNAVAGNNIHRLLRLNGGPATTVASRPIINGLAATDISGGRGASGTGSAKNVIVSCPNVPNNVSWNGGAAGGQGNSLNDPGGSISLLNSSLNTLISLGPPNIPRKGSNAVIISPCDNQAGNCNPNSPQMNICGSFSPGYGAGGGFGGNVSSVSGGAGFRGGGGGGGGGNGSGGLPASNGGNGGNGYVCIVALE